MAISITVHPTLHISAELQVFIQIKSLASLSSGKITKSKGQNINGVFLEQKRCAENK